MQRILNQSYEEEAEGGNTEESMTDLTELTDLAESTPIVQDQFAPPLTQEQLAAIVNDPRMMWNIAIVDEIPLDSNYHGTDYAIHEPNARPKPVYRITLPPQYPGTERRAWLFRIPDQYNHLSTLFTYDKSGNVDAKISVREIDLRSPSLSRPSSFLLLDHAGQQFKHQVHRYGDTYNVNESIFLGYNIKTGRACIGYYASSATHEFADGDVISIAAATQIQPLDPRLQNEYMEVLKAAKIFDVLCYFFSQSLGVTELRNIKMTEIDQLRSIAYAIARGRYAYGNDIEIGIPQSITNKKGEQKVKISWLNLEFLEQTVDQF